MKQKIKTVIWLLIAFLALAFLLYRTPLEHLQKAFDQANWKWVTFACLLYLLAQTLLAVRWILLLRVQKVFISFFQAVKLTYLGLFYNNMMPGAVGGDLLKAWYITRHSDKQQRVGAAVTVFVDRIVGLIGMIMVAGIAGLTAGGRLPITIFGRQVQVRKLIWVIFLALSLCAFIFLSRRLRKYLSLDRLIEKLPFKNLLAKIDQAIQLYRHHLLIMLAALGITAVIQGMAIVSIWMLSQSLHLVNITFWHCLMVMPIVWLISAAVPVPGGLGVMENLFMPFFYAAALPTHNISPEQEAALRASVAALALLNRFMICICSLPGGLVPVFGGHLPNKNELEIELQNE